MGKLAELGRWREKSEAVLTRAAYLPAADRAIVEAYLKMGMTVGQIAVLHRISPRMMRRRIERLGGMLADPCFALAAQYGGKLPSELAKLASGYWMEGRPLRELAAMRGETLHAVRRKIGMVRSLLLVQMAGKQVVPSQLAHAALDGRYPGG